MKQLTLRQIKNGLRRFDPTMDGEEYNVALILLSALNVGSNIRRIARFTGLTYRHVTEVGRRLRSNGVWVGRKTACNWDDKDGGLEFILDITVGLGFVERT